MGRGLHNLPPDAGETPLMKMTGKRDGYHQFFIAGLGMMKRYAQLIPAQSWSHLSAYIRPDFETSRTLFAVPTDVSRISCNWSMLTAGSSTDNSSTLLKKGAQHIEIIQFVAQKALRVLNKDIWCTICSSTWWKTQWSWLHHWGFLWCWWPCLWTANKLK